MNKSLQEMTLEELWHLFPIFLVPHNEKWKAQYISESNKLSDLLSDKAIINHIGSTSINGIWAKNIVDILVELPMEENLTEAAENLSHNGYNIMSSDENRISLNKGYTENGFSDEVFHLHIRRYGDNRELYFRDYLNEHPIIAKEYVKMKASLWKKHRYNRDAYTDGKSQFINNYTDIAISLYNHKYDRK